MKLTLETPFAVGEKVSHIASPDVCGVITYLLVDYDRRVNYCVRFDGIESDQQCQAFELVEWGMRYESEINN